MEIFDLTNESIGQLANQPKSVFFHCTKNMMDGLLAGRLDFINLVAGLMADAGYQIYAVTAGNLIEAAAAADLRHLHIAMQDRPMIGHNIVFCVPAYLHGHWYFDAMGTRNNSSLRIKTFAPQRMGEHHAMKVFNRLRAKFVDANKSKFGQEMVAGFTPKNGAICIFTQDFKQPPHHRHHLSMQELIELTIKHRDGRQVYIKPHPGQTLAESQILLGYHDPENGVEITTHSIHGLLPHAALAVSLTSAVCFEANLHRTPSLLAGQTDFHHNAITLTDPDKFADAMAAALSRDFPYEKYLTWFLTQELFQPKFEKMTRERIAENLALKGFFIAKTAETGFY